MSTTEPTPIEPDTKDWTFVLGRVCPECGFDASAVDPGGLGDAVRATVPRWTSVLARPDVRVRPVPEVWSPLEYGAHVRDVLRVFDERVRLMLAEDEPRFPNWDQDQTARALRYDLADPVAVAGELLEAATAVADLYDGVPPDAWGRRGLRSNGSEFSVETLGRYHLHDIVHHRWDVDGTRWPG